MERNGYRLWKREGPAALVRRRTELLRAWAVDVVLTTRRRRPWLDHPELARMVLERALDEPETLAISVLPDRVLWLLEDGWDLDRLMRSFRLQAGEYAEIHGAPVDRVWQRWFWYRPLAEPEAVAERAREIARAPEEAGLPARHSSWPDGLSDLEGGGRVLQRAWQSAEVPGLWEVEGTLIPY